MAYNFDLFPHLAGVSHDHHGETAAKMSKVRRSGLVAKDHQTSSPSPSKPAVVKSVAHLSIELIESYALRELSEVEIRRVEKHVVSCPECEDRLQEEVDSWAAMRSSTTAMVRKIAKAERKRAAKR